MDDIVLTQFIIKEKEEQIDKLKKNIFTLNNELRIQIKKYVDDNREKILNEDYHYNNNHIIDVVDDYYYDYDWYYNEYGKKRPTDDFGRLLPYEGPNKLLFISCSDCNIHLEISYKDNYGDVDISNLGKEKFDEYILQKKIKELST